VSEESGAWALARDEFDNLYIGTLPHAHLLQLNPRTGDFRDLGRPSDSEAYIWALTLGADGKLYGATYPSAKLIRFDPSSGRSDDLGSLDAQEHYARWIAASEDGFIYIGVGYAVAHLIAYEIASDQYRDILPGQYHTSGVVSVGRRSDGLVYASMGMEGHRRNPFSGAQRASEQSLAGWSYPDDRRQRGDCA
jgi:streptogramin lyase